MIAKNIFDLTSALRFYRGFEDGAGGNLLNVKLTKIKVALVVVCAVCTASTNHFGIQMFQRRCGVFRRTAWSYGRAATVQYCSIYSARWQWAQALSWTSTHCLFFCGVKLFARQDNYAEVVFLPSNGSFSCLPHDLYGKPFELDFDLLELHHKIHVLVDSCSSLASRLTEKLTHARRRTILLVIFYSLLPSYAKPFEHLVTSCPCPICPY